MPMYFRVVSNAWGSRVIPHPVPEKKPKNTPTFTGIKTPTKCEIRCHCDDVTWKRFPRYHGPPCGESGGFPPTKGQNFTFYLVLAWPKGWTNVWAADDLRRHDVYRDVIAIQCADGDTRLMICAILSWCIAFYCAASNPNFSDCWNPYHTDVLGLGLGRWL